MKRKIYLIVSIDTECDKDLNWQIPKPIGFENIFLQKKLLFPLFKKYNIKPTYLLSPEVLLESCCVDFFKRKHEIDLELGTHLHSEFIEPKSNFEAKATNVVQCSLPDELEFQKLEKLTQLFSENFGYNPRCFRSGRFGSSKDTEKYLFSLGYKVDSSVTPYKTHYFDFNLKVNNWGTRLEPYFLKFKNVNFVSGRILQVPLTLINVKFEKLPVFVLNKIETRTTLFKKILFHLGINTPTRWLRPNRENGKGLIEIADYVINNHFRKKNHVVLNVMFHSNEILEKASPYCKTKEDVQNYINSLDELFNHLNKNHDLCSIGLGELYEIYSRN